jgi:hypothetical protein
VYSIWFQEARIQSTNGLLVVRMLGMVGGGGGGDL